MHVKTLMASPVITIEEDAPLRRAREAMRRAGRLHLPVVRAASLLGVLSDRDLLRVGPSKVPSLARYELPCLLDDLPVRQAMTRDMTTLSPDTSVEAAARFAREKQAEILPVLDGGELVGIVTRKDLLGVLIGLLEQQAATTFGQILVPTDFGEPATRAFTVAVEMAHRHRTGLTLLHVLPPQRRVAAMEAAPSEVRAQLAERHRRECLDRLRSLLPAHAESRRTACELAVGEPAAEIVKAAGRLEADLIVMGTCGRRGLERFLWGSVAAEVIRRAPCPVLVVKR